MLILLLLGSIFFITDVRDGLGSYLGMFLKEHQFTESQIGLITTRHHYAL
ncbi:hypothetical protein [Campylobacter upsaliensis]|nr:hypothetical protein [Campylobacter upsaliensis]MCR2100268.1 hypothetical protein [Campylobacter upsaliensis]